MFIYDLVENKFIFSENIHMGGIEGISWRGDILVTCSSDLTVNMINTKKIVKIEKELS